MGGVNRSKQEKFRRGLVYIIEAFQLSSDEARLFHLLAIQRLFGQIGDDEERSLIAPMSEQFQKAFSDFKAKFPRLFPSALANDAEHGVESS